MALRVQQPQPQDGDRGGGTARSGWLADTGERRGVTKQIKVYRVNIGTIPKSEPSQKRNSTEIAQKQSQKWDTEPVSNLPSSDTSYPSKEVVAAEAAPDEPTSLRPEHVLEAWNEMADRSGLPKARMTDERRKKLRTAVRRWTVDDFGTALTAVERSPFCLGENNRGWRANFDFLLQPRSFTKLMEGAYGG